jgi:BTB/POZ domain-containing protein KCTD9
MNENLSRFLDGLFARYEESEEVKIIKEELLHDLEERYADLQRQGYDEESAYNLTIGSIGDISEIMESVAAQPKTLLQLPRKDFNLADLRDADLSGVTVQQSRFNAVDLRDANFSGSDLSGSSFRMCELRDASFAGANLSGATFVWCELRDATFTSAILNQTHFERCEMRDTSFDYLTLNATVFNHTSLRDATFRQAVLRHVAFRTNVQSILFDGVMMDKFTYATLKSLGADLSGVNVLQAED